MQQLDPPVKHHAIKETITHFMLNQHVSNVKLVTTVTTQVWMKWMSAQLVIIVLLVHKSQLIVQQEHMDLVPNLPNQQIV